MHALTGGKVRVVLKHRALFGMSLSGDQYFSKHYSAAMIDIGDTPGTHMLHYTLHSGAYIDMFHILPSLFVEGDGEVDLVMYVL